MRIPHALRLVLLAAIGCHHPSQGPSMPTESHAAPRLSRPEQVIIPPGLAHWPRPVPNGQFPHYPKDARSAGVEGRVLAAFVIDEAGRPELVTISILQSSSSPRRREFVSSVCTFLRDDARFSWDPHTPVRGLVIMPFEFHLSSRLVTEPILPMPDLKPVGDSLRQMSPPELARWIDSQEHCF